MDAIGWYWWAGIAALILVLALAFRKGGFRLGAEAFGAKVEVEGRNGAPPARDPAPNPPSPTATTATAKGRGNIAVGGNATGTFTAGDPGRER